MGTSTMLQRTLRTPALRGALSALPRPDAVTVAGSMYRYRQSSCFGACRPVHEGNPETPQCGFSRTSIQILGLQGVDPRKFTAFNVLEDEELRSGIKEYSDWPTIPQLYIDKEFVGGCDI